MMVWERKRERERNYAWKHYLGRRRTSPQGLFREMESSQAVWAIFTSIITALSQSLMLYDSCAGPQTALGGCGSRWATGIMAPVNLQYRTFIPEGLHVSWRDWINTVWNTELSPTASSSSLTPTVQCILIAMPSRSCCRLSSLECNTTKGWGGGGGGGVKTTFLSDSEAKNSSFHPGWGRF